MWSEAKKKINQFKKIKPAFDVLGTGYLAHKAVNTANQPTGYYRREDLEHIGNELDMEGIRREMEPALGLGEFVLRPIH